MLVGEQLFEYGCEFLFFQFCMQCEYLVVWIGFGEFEDVCGDVVCVDVVDVEYFVECGQCGWYLYV